MAKKAVKKSAAKKASGVKSAPKKDQSAVNDTAGVDAFMKQLDHPFKAEVEVVRKIIKGVHPGITEQWKWNAPSFSYKGYLVTFNLWEKERVHLVFHNGAILNDQDGFLQGNYPDRRMAYFLNKKEIKAKQPVLEAVIHEWIAAMDKK
jgi:hypothetical protein